MSWFAAQASIPPRKFAQPCSQGGGLHRVRSQNSRRAFATQSKQHLLRHSSVGAHGFRVLVLIETVSVLDSVFELEHAQIALAVEMLLNHRDLVLQDADVVQAALAHYRKRSKVGFSDCMVLEVARKAGHIPLGTFERLLSKLDGVDAV